MFNMIRNAISTYQSTDKDERYNTEKGYVFQYWQSDCTCVTIKAKLKLYLPCY